MKVQNIWKIGIAGGSILFLGLLFYASFPSIINQEVKAKIALEKGKLRRFIWDKPPFFLSAKFYLYNVTNPDGVMNGDKPVLQQVGPYVYDMIFEHTNQIDNDTDDTVSFTTRHTYFFNADKSQGLTGEEVVVVPNLFIVTSLNYVLRTMPGAISLLSKAIDSIFGEPESLFVKVKASDMLFNGVPLNCNATDFAGSSVCREIKSRYQDFNMIKVNENVFLYSLWGAQNGTDSRERTRVSRGVRRIEDVGKVVEFNGKPNMTYWGDPYCDKIDGTDGSIFHPFFDEDGQDPLAIFIPSMCRTFRYQFDSKTRFLGLDALRYTTDIGVDGQHDALDKCYCMDPANCLRKGVFDMFKCSKLPLILSNPHFLRADPYYLAAVDGMKPDEEKHVSYVDVDPLTGTPMIFCARIQVNMMIINLDKFRLMNNVPTKMLPLFWIEEEFAAPDHMMADLISAHHMISLAKSFKILMVLAGLGLSGYALYLYYKTSYGSSNLVSKKAVQSANSGNTSSGSNMSSADNKRIPINMSTLQPPRIN